MHSNIPNMATPRPETKKELTNRYAILADLKDSITTDDMAEEVIAVHHQETAKVVETPATQPAKQPASNSSQEKAPVKKSPTIVAPSIMPRVGRAGQQSQTSGSENAAPQSPSLNGGIEEIAKAKPPLGMANTALGEESKSPNKQEAPCQPTNTSSTVQWTPTNINKGARTGQAMPKVSMVEVPDKEDDTSFQKWKRTNPSPSIASEVTQPTVAKSSDFSAKAEKVPHLWLKPFQTQARL